MEGAIPDEVDQEGCPAVGKMLTPVYQVCHGFLQLLDILRVILEGSTFEISPQHTMNTLKLLSDLHYAPNSFV